MNNKNLLILGGYGCTGARIARLLLEQSSARVCLAGRNVARAAVLAEELNAGFDGQRVSAVYADASDPNSLARALESVDLVVVASSTSEWAAQIARTALECSADYLDVQYSSKKLAALQQLAGQIEAAGRWFVTDGGFHPGLPAALVRYAASCFEQLLSANVGSVIKIDWANLEVGTATIEELVGELADYQGLVYKAGAWRKASNWEMMKPLWMEFGGEFGRQYCAPMFLEELRSLPALYPSLLETGFYVGGFNPVVDWLVMPLVLAATKLGQERAIPSMARLMHWGLKRFSKPPYGTLLKLEARGQRNGREERLELVVSHPDGYVLTAVPVVACLLQYLDGNLKQPGLWYQALVVEPRRLLQDMQRMGVRVEVRSASL